MILSLSSISIQAPWCQLVEKIFLKKDSESMIGGSSYASIIILILGSRYIAIVIERILPTHFISSFL